MEQVCAAASYNTCDAEIDASTVILDHARPKDLQMAATEQARGSMPIGHHGSWISRPQTPEALITALSIMDSRERDQPRNSLRKVQSSSPRRFQKPSFTSPFPVELSTIPTLHSLKADYPTQVLDAAVVSRLPAASHLHPRHAHSWPSTVSVTGSVASSIAITPPLTPPEKDAFMWNIPSPSVNRDNIRQASLSAESDSGRADMPSRHSSDRSSDRPSTIILPPSGNFEQQSNPMTWLDRALRSMHSTTDLQKECSELQVVVQAMPSHVGRIDTAPRQIFEEICLRVQRLARVPYVRITHAYTKRFDVSLKDAPISPPATPNVVGGQDYFDDWTICTNLARIPDYHGGPVQDEHRNPRVAAPNRIHASVLERYLPPTTSQEVRDFFSLSKRSYLVDRLNELHDGGDGPSGALLLVYPTLSGGKTFKTYYKDPVLDPLLRRFMMLRGLTTLAGEALGKMEAIDSLLSFEDMQTTIQALCHQLGQQLPPSGRASQFVIDHAEQTDVVLDRDTWIEHFLAQESSRMRQDLVDYQKSGQRMPAQGFEASPAALAREVEDGIRSSAEAAGGVGIEVGVFVIRRTMF